MKNDRLFQIIYMLLEKKMVTARELADRFSVSIRTIYRDMETLSVSGVPVYTMPGRGGGISLLPGFVLDKSLFSEEEQNEILFALQSLQAADRKLDPLLSKLGNVFQKGASDWIEVDFSRWGYRRVDTERFERLKRSILDKQVLHITYCGANGMITERDIKPVKLVYKDKNWYVRGFCLKAGDFRVFKLNRIIGLTLTGRRFEEEFNEIPPLEKEGPAAVLEPVVLQFSAEAAFRVYEEFDRENIKKQPDGSLLVTVQLSLDSWVTGYLLSFGTQVEIEEPSSLKAQLADSAEKIYRHHKS